MRNSRKDARAFPRPVKGLGDIITMDHCSFYDHGMNYALSNTVVALVTRAVATTFVRWGDLGAKNGVRPLPQIVISPFSAAHVGQGAHVRQPQAPHAPLCAAHARDHHSAPPVRNDSSANALRCKAATGASIRLLVYSQGILCSSMTCSLCQFLRFPKPFIIAESDFVCGLCCGTSGRC